MSFHSWLQNLRSALTLPRCLRHRGRRGSQWAATYRLHFETLEDRLTPTFLWAGSYSEAPVGVVWSPPPPLLGDFTSDGILDQINTGWHSEGGGIVTDMVVRPGRGDGTFGDPIASYAPNAGYFAVADFNGDGRLDVFTAAPASAAADPGTSASGDTLLGRGDGRFDLWHTQGLGDVYNLTQIGTGNLYSDRVDVVVSGTSFEGMGTFAVMFNDGIWPNSAQLRIDDTSVIEGNTGVVEAIFTVTLANGANQPVTVQYATVDLSATAGSDYLAASGALTFAPGETSKTIAVRVNGDLLAEPNEYFFIYLSSPTNAVIADDRGVGAIVNDEPLISITPSVSGSEGNTGQTPFSFAVTLSSASETPVTVDWATADSSATAGFDYLAATGTLIFGPGETSKTITILVNGDRLPEPNEAFVVNLTSASNATIAAGQGTGTIVDDEPRISISDVTKREGRKNTTSFVFTVTLSAAYDQPVTMSYRTTNGTATTGDGDYIARTGTLTFAPGETTKTITIEVKGDSKKEADEIFYLDLFGLGSNALFTRSRGIGTILNDD